jgi:uncharacterized membrane protein YqaE (UPF0057 family)
MFSLVRWGALAGALTPTTNTPAPIRHRLPDTERRPAGDDYGCRHRRGWLTRTRRLGKPLPSAMQLAGLPGLGQAWDTCGMKKILLIILALFLPFLAVLLHEGLTRRVLWAIVFQLLGHIPGIVYGIYVVTSEPRGRR